MRFATRLILLLLLTASLHATVACGQSVQPLIAEIQGRAEGKFAITNNTLEPLIANIEPRSFSIGLDGKGVFRKLDPAIHLELSSMSVRLQPNETYWVFYKASAENLPAWFSIYTTFIPVRHNSTLELRIQLPHTVYLYGKAAIAPADIKVQSLAYDRAAGKIVLELQNTGTALGRVQQVQPFGKGIGSTDPLAGFPMLPGATRRVELPWQGKELPRGLQIVFPKFKLEPELTERAPGEAAVPSSTSGNATAGDK